MRFYRKAPDVLARLPIRLSRWRSDPDARPSRVNANDPHARRRSMNFRRGSRHIHRRASRSHRASRHHRGRHASAHRRRGNNSRTSRPRCLSCRTPVGTAARMRNRSRGNRIDRRRSHIPARPRIPRDSPLQPIEPSMQSACSRSSPSWIRIRKIVRKRVQRRLCPQVTAVARHWACTIAAPRFNAMTARQGRELFAPQRFSAS